MKRLENPWTLDEVDDGLWHGRNPRTHAWTEDADDVVDVDDAVDAVEQSE